MVTKLITDNAGYQIEFSENEEIVKETLEELSYGKGDEEDEQ